MNSNVNELAFFVSSRTFIVYVCVYITPKRNRNTIEIHLFDVPYARARAHTGNYQLFVERLNLLMYAIEIDVCTMR